VRYLGGETTGLRADTGLRRQETETTVIGEMTELIKEFGSRRDMEEK
jgi:hypothetical protein